MAQPITIDQGAIDQRRSVRRRALLGLAIALDGANPQPALASVGPVLADVRRDLGLSGAEAAVLTAAPVLCFGTLAATAPALARRWGWSGSSPVPSP